MFKKYYPCAYEENVFTIDYDTLGKMGYKGLIFDIDNTLVPHGEPSTAEVDALFKKLHEMGFKTLLLSDNSEERISSFNRNIGALYVAEAGKPDKSAYLKAAKLINMPRRKLICIGDQVFKDVLGANNSGIACILVKYIGYYKKEKKGIRRRLEKIILWFYKRNRKATHSISEMAGRR